MPTNFKDFLGRIDIYLPYLTHKNKELWNVQNAEEFQKGYIACRKDFVKYLGEWAWSNQVKIFGGEMAKLRLKLIAEKKKLPQSLEIAIACLGEAEIKKRLEAKK